MTGAAIGMSAGRAALIHVHIRMDFLLLRGQSTPERRREEPVHVRRPSQHSARGAGNDRQELGTGAQHSQGLHSFFMHVPGIKVVAPVHALRRQGHARRGGS